MDICEKYRFFSVMRSVDRRLLRWAPAKSERAMCGRRRCGAARTLKKSRFFGTNKIRLNGGRLIPAIAAAGTVGTSERKGNEEGNDIQRPWIGISGLTITSSIAKQLDIDSESGVYVASVVENSPAEAAGIIGGEANSTDDIARGGDIITGVDNVEVEEFVDLASYVLTKKIGDNITLTIIRDGEIITVDIILDAKPIEFYISGSEDEDILPWEIPGIPDNGHDNPFFHDAPAY